MYCPNCQEEIKPTVIDNQKVLHCKQCGGTYFEQNGINRISVQTAQQLAFDRKNTTVFETPKNCPIDRNDMKPIIDDEAVPKNALLYQCPVCRGIFVHPDDLMRFKAAQKAKIDYYKLWEMPLPAVRSVLVATFVGVISLSLFSAFTSTQSPNIQTIQAEDVVKNVHVSHTGRYVFISFRTDADYTSKIIFTNLVTGEEIVKDLSKTPSKLHYLTTTDLDPTHAILYQITVRDANGREVTTQKKPLSIQ